MVCPLYLQILISRASCAGLSHLAWEILLLTLLCEVHFLEETSRGNATRWEKPADDRDLSHLLGDSVGGTDDAAQMRSFGMRKLTNSSTLGSRLRHGVGMPVVFLDHLLR